MKITCLEEHGATPGIIAAWARIGNQLDQHGSQILQKARERVEKVARLLIDIAGDNQELLAKMLSNVAERLSHRSAEPT